MKNILLLIFLFFGAITLSFAQKPNLKAGLITHFSFSQNANDSSGFKLNPSVSGGAGLKEGARCGQGAFYFDGKDDYIDYGNHKAFERGLRELSVAFWVKPDKDKFNEDFLTMIVGKWAFDPKQDQFAVFLNAHQHLVMSVGDGIEHGGGVHSKRKLENGIWYHVVAIWQNPNKVKFFINGKPESEGLQEKTQGMNANSPVSLKVGRQLLKHNRAFGGFLSSLRMYSRALSDEEIRLIYKQENSICIKFVLEGSVLNEKNMQPVDVPVDVIIKDLKTGAELFTAHSDPADGYYHLELPVGFQYGIFAKAENYKFVSLNQNIDTRAKGFVTPGVAKEVVIKRDILMIPFEVGGKVAVNNVFFESAKTDLQPESYPELDYLVQMFVDIPTLKVEIGGHTDNVGNPASNQKLSEGRANSVRNYLISKGISGDRITAKGYGQDIPIDTNDTDEGKQRNRRVEFTIAER
ncbi:MAG: hypothetical protein EAZ97_06160 [Bacteroidetes bacterium]|nr:MAG: hypothetical protein EAZ97_06160 [Bacteroidota bacterium]